MSTGRLIAPHLWFQPPLPTDFHLVVQVTHRTSRYLVEQVVGLSAEMLEELDSASEQLHVALERYLHVCSGIHGLFLQGTSPRNVLPEYDQRVKRELELVESYDLTMQKAKLAIKTTRNYAFSIAPVNCLPLEILTHIFHMVHDSEPCRIGHLALVCSRWRSIALSLPSLWSHIDYHPHLTKWFYPELIERAKLHISRSAKIPLDFHLSVSSESYNNACYDNPVERLCEVVAPRMGSLELDMEGFIREWPGDTENSVVSAVFSNCTPGVLTKLVTLDPERFGFITTPEEHSDDSVLRIGIGEDLDEILSPITVLHLTGLFLPWTSHAYHELVDLRLFASSTGDSSDNTIPESHLVQILEASPRLRILYLQLRTTGQVAEGSAVHRVRLAELEALQLRFGYDTGVFHIEHFLRWLEPGSKPLRLSIRYSDSKSDQELAIPETKAFLTRSNVTKLYAGALPRLSELLPLLPHLKVLVVSDQRHLIAPDPPTRSNPPPTYPQLDLCYFPRSSLSLGGFLQLIQCCRAKTIVLFGNEFHRSPSEKVKTEMAEKELSDLCSDVRVAHIHPRFLNYHDLWYDC